MKNSDKSYLLVIKRDNNDYLPLEWQYTKLYDKEDLNSLEGIDHYTSSHFEDEIIEDAVNSNLVDEDTKYKSSSIIFNENGKYRELKEGVIFLDEVLYLDFKRLISFIELNLDNKNMINNIVGVLNSIKNPSEELLQFVYILKNINLFREKGEKTFKVALSKFLDLTYSEKRKVAIIVNRKYGPFNLEGDND